MTNIISLPLGSYQTNCYIVHDSSVKSCAIIDPGYEAETILQKVHALGLTVDAVLLTHGHFDPVGAVEEIVAQTGCALWLSQSDWSQFPNPVTAYFYPLANCDFTEVHFPEDGDVIHAGGLAFTVLEAPGHTWGSVCYHCGDALFSGDTLFAGSCGRTDLPGGDKNTMDTSLERLKELPGTVRVFPGHGGSSTMSRELQCNPFLI